VLAGCARVTGGSLVVPAALSDAAAQRNVDDGFKQLYSFEGNPDGAAPSKMRLVTLRGVPGVFYGTTVRGGNGKCFAGVLDAGCGTIFKVTRDGAESVLYSFAGGTDGVTPTGVTAFNGTLYGTTESGGAKGEGTLYALNIRTGSKRIIYNFQGGADGAQPQGIVVIKGELFGTTLDGGENDGGTVFKVNVKTGVEQIVYRFKGGSDGARPGAGLLLLNSELYGTAYAGGHGNHGVVFRLGPSGNNYRVLHAFTGLPEGQVPQPYLVTLNGMLYGTTIVGGRTFDGTIFRLSLSGEYKQLYAFGADSDLDGKYPRWGLTVMNGKLYGTTLYGGKYSCYDPFGKNVGCGTVFQITPAGAYHVLYSFKGEKDGEYSRCGLMASGGILYGATLEGGARNAGTIFALKP
jgi:uncharacterized repeat protein (TIGR03803 family)